MTTTFNARAAVLSVLAFGAALFLTVAVLNAPRNPSDPELVAYWQQAGHRTEGVVSGVLALAAAALFALVLEQLRRLPGIDEDAVVMGFARVMGGAFVTTMLVTGALRGLVGRVVDTFGDPLPPASSLRLMDALSYGVLGVAAMTAIALCIASLGLAVCRTRALPIWSGVASVALGGVILAAVVVGYGPFAIPIVHLWCVLLAVAVSRRGGPARPSGEGSLVAAGRPQG